MRVALLGGTAEARELAQRLDALPDVWVETSLAGRLERSGAGLAGSVRVGGFDAVEPLIDYLGGFDAVIDATHPFAAEITRLAVAAARSANRPLLVVRRPGWSPAPGDDWRRVPSVAAAAALVRTLAAESVLMTIGRTQLGAFAEDPRRFVIRSIEAPTGPMPVHSTVLLERGPFSVARERELMVGLGIDVVVSKDSGGSAVAAKLGAARELGLPVVLIDRPPLPVGARVVESVPAALGWLLSSSR